ncbi:MAG: RluA family pseudouridine synthase [Acholeplasmatales bacterium]|nr:RluA family pseudouridine synthase [Acholeplasmatales bacterium]
MKEEIEIIVDEAGERIDKYLASHTTLSRNKIQNLLDNELITVNEKLVKANYKVKENDLIIVSIPFDEDYDLEPVNMNLDIVYEDSDVLVVNKPQGLIVHPTLTTKEKTLVNGLMYQIKDLSGINGVNRPGIVHRIDKDTSGLLMVAKNDFAHNSLVQQLMNKTTTRVYIALVYGIIEESKGRINAPIGRDKLDRKKMAVVEGGKPAVTNFTVLERFDGYTLVECRLETGRTHQIRVHMKYIGHPLVGDPLYGPKKQIGNTGQYLHAKIIGFNHPRTNKYLEFDSELPDNFKDILEKLRKGEKING